MAYNENTELINHTISISDNESSESNNMTKLFKEVKDKRDESLFKIKEIDKIDVQNEALKKEKPKKEKKIINDDYCSNIEKNDKSIDPKKLKIDQNDICNTINNNDSKTPFLLKASSNIITEVVVGKNEEVTLDLSKSIPKSLKSTNPDGMTDNYKRDQTYLAEDLSLPTKRRKVANGEHNEINGTLDLDEENEDNCDKLIMPPTPPQDDLEDFERIQKLKVYHRLKRELLNADSKLVLLKKIRQSQQKEYISQSNTQHTSTTPSTGSITSSTPSTISMGINLTSNLRDLNILTNNKYQASAVNFSTTHNLKSVSGNIINNNVAHINSHPKLFLKNNLTNLNIAHQAPMQAHQPKTTSHLKGNSALNPPFTSSLGRSPYNHLNSHLSAPPPLHGSNSNSSKQRAPSYDTPNINTAHSSHRTSSISNTNSLNRSSLATPPNLGYPELRQPSSNTKYNQVCC